MNWLRAKRIVCEVFSDNTGVKIAAKGLVVNQSEMSKYSLSCVDAASKGSNVIIPLPSHIVCKGRNDLDARYKIICEVSDYIKDLWGVKVYASCQQVH